MTASDDETPAVRSTIDCTLPVQLVSNCYGRSLPHPGMQKDKPQLTQT